jgi:hypothetical protein
MMKNIVRVLMLSLQVLLYTSGCGTTTPPPSQEEPLPFVSIKRVSNASPEIGERVTISWQYRQDVQPRQGPDLARQVIQLISLTIDGGFFVDTRGCLPAGHVFLYGHPPGECLSLEQREFRFDFAGPVLFRLLAFPDEGPDGDGMHALIRAIKFTLPNMSFEFSVHHLQDRRYPYIFGGGGGEFERAFGIYEVSDATGEEDGIIDEFGPGTQLGQAFPTNVETLDGQNLMPVFFGSSSMQEESQHFGFRRGGNFPLLQEGFLDTPNGQFFRDIKTHANIIILGGSIRFDQAFDPEKELVKADNGDEVLVTSASNLQPFFIQIDVRSADVDPRQYVICDIHIIAPSQGLVLSTFVDHNSPLSPPTLGANQIDVNDSPSVLMSSGMIKDALTGFDILTSRGVSYRPAQAKVSVEWSNIPIYPDNDISGLRQTYVTFINDP